MNSNKDIRIDCSCQTRMYARVIIPP